jgi:8-oxo-dGTP diphosphatase
MAMNGIVRAAGGLIVRPGTGQAEILLVHRPAYDDWSFPKGKLLPDEDEARGALREVEEETGLLCHLERLLGSVGYTDRRGRPKTVEYWLMSVLGGEFVPTREVDRVRWVPLSEARRALTYKRDRGLIDPLEQELAHYGEHGVPASSSPRTAQ